MQFADNEGPDQPAHSRRLIWTFVVRSKHGYCGIFRRTETVQIRLQRGAHSSEHSLFAYDIQAFSLVANHIILNVKKQESSCKGQTHEQEYNEDPSK